MPARYPRLPVPGAPYAALLAAGERQPIAAAS